VNALAVDPGDPDRILAGLDRLGIWRSRDGGSAWASDNQGLRALAVSLIEAAPRAPGTLYAAAQNRGLLKSVDGGATWSSGSFGPSLGGVLETPRRLVFDGRAPGLIYGVTSNLWKTGDGGIRWRDLLPVVGDGVVVADDLAMDPRDPRVLYLVGDQVFCLPDAENCDLDTFRVSKLARSADGGRHWTVLDFGPLHTPAAPTSAKGLPVWRSVAVAPDGTVYLAGSALLSSANGGTSWQSLPNPPGPASGQGIKRLFVLPGGPVPGAAPLVFAVVPVATSFDLSGPTRLFVSRDGGHRWLAGDDAFAPDLPPGTVAVTDLVASRRPYRLYAGTDHGVFVSRDASGDGPHWAPLLAGLEDPAVQSLSIDSATGVVYAATEHAGGLFALRP